MKRNFFCFFTKKTWTPISKSNGGCWRTWCSSVCLCSSLVGVCAGSSDLIRTEIEVRLCLCSVCARAHVHKCLLVSACVVHRTRVHTTGQPEKGKNAHNSPACTPAARLHARHLLARCHETLLVCEEPLLHRARVHTTREPEKGENAHLKPM